MLKSAIKKGVDKEAFEFMKWWVSADTQTEYGKELEATMGIAGRYTPANKVALNNLGWSNAEKRVLNELLNDVVLVEQVPGNYLLPRSLTTAFRSSVTGENRARRALTIANKEINDELARKREEFNLD
jgi:ABC-type glycerol-3-phosphate transport system substrate-binding protein